MVVVPFAGAGAGGSTQVGVTAPFVTMGSTPYPGDTDAPTESIPLIVSPVSAAMVSACAFASASAAGCGVPWARIGSCSSRPGPATTS